MITPKTIPNIRNEKKALERRLVLKEKLEGVPLVTLTQATVGDVATLVKLVTDCSSLYDEDVSRLEQLYESRSVPMPTSSPYDASQNAVSRRATRRRPRRGY